MIRCIMVAALGLVGGPLQGPTAPPFERQGHALLSAARAGRPTNGNGLGASREAGWLSLLAPVHERVDLGAIELWLPTGTVDPAASWEASSRPSGWTDMASDLLDLQEAWLARLGELRGARGRELEGALGTLRQFVRRAHARRRVALDDGTRAASARLRGALLDAQWRDHGLVLLLAPTRAQYVALIGATGIERPATRPDLWTEFARRSASARLSTSTLAFALAWGPRGEDEPWHREHPMQGTDARQQAVHSASHLLSGLMLSTSTVWFQEGLAIVDTIGVTGADETLCTGSAPRESRPFDDWQQVPEAFLACARLERSPFRGTGSRRHFVPELEKARARDGFHILDLDRGRSALVTPGPFLGDLARVPAEVADGPPGLEQGYGEFFRAYCAAFVAWLGEERDERGVDLLERTLVALRARGRALDGAPRRDLEEILREVSGRTLGRSFDPELDLEAAFVDRLSGRR